MCDTVGPNRETTMNRFQTWSYGDDKDNGGFHFHGQISPKVMVQEEMPT